MFLRHTKRKKTQGATVIVASWRISRTAAAGLVQRPPVVQPGVEIKRFSQELAVGRKSSPSAWRTGALVSRARCSRFRDSLRRDCWPDGRLDRSCVRASNELRLCRPRPVGRECWLALILWRELDFDVSSGATACRRAASVLCVTGCCLLRRPTGFCTSHRVSICIANGSSAAPVADLLREDLGRRNTQLYRWVTPAARTQSGLFDSSGLRWRDLFNISFDVRSTI